MRRPRGASRLKLTFRLLKLRYTTKSPCPACRSLNLNRVFHPPGAMFAQDQQPVVLKTIILAQLDLRCPLCNLLETMIRRTHMASSTPWDQTWEIQPNHLIAYALEAECIGQPLAEDITTYIGITPERLGIESGINNDGTQRWLLHEVDGYEFRLSMRRGGTLAPLFPPGNASRLQGRLMDRHRIDFEIVRNWLTQCRKEHAECAPSIHPTAYPHRLVDCHTRSIVQNLDLRTYAALSYVWGASPTSSKPARDYVLGDTLRAQPRTIEDAITVTKELNLRYLWVDRLCLTQHDTTSFHQELKAMAVYYAAAQVTIIAAAGDHANHGLPGVSSVPRSEQSYVVSGKYRFVHFATPLTELMRDATYSTRAWAYQEEASSVRRLYFTGEQLFYECYASQSCETIHIMNNLPPTMRFRMRYLINSRIEVPSRHLSTSWVHISEVSKRNLTYESDALNAVLGLLEWGSTWMKTTHIYGIPIPPPHEEDDSPDRIDQEFLQQLSWSFHYGDGTNYRRNVLFPTWSWLAWTKTGICRPIIRFSYEKPCVKVLFETSSQGGLLQLKDLAQTSFSSYQSMPRVLVIETLTCELRLERKPRGSDSCRLDIITEDPSGTSKVFTSSLSLDQLERLDLRQLGPGGIIGLFIDKGHNKSNPRAYELVELLVVAAVNGKDEPFERVGRVIYEQMDINHVGGSDRIPWEVRTVRLG